jgi:hypothetical protein
MVIVSELKLHDTPQLVLVFRHCCRWAKLMQLSCSYATSNGVCMPIRLPLDALHSTRRMKFFKRKIRRKIPMNAPKKNKKTANDVVLLDI